VCTGDEAISRRHVRRDQRVLSVLDDVRDLWQQHHLRQIEPRAQRLEKTVTAEYHLTRSDVLCDRRWLNGSMQQPASGHVRVEVVQQKLSVRIRLALNVALEVEPNHIRLTLSQMRIQRRTIGRQVQFRRQSDLDAIAHAGHCVHLAEQLQAACHGQIAVGFQMAYLDLLGTDAYTGFANEHQIIRARSARSD
jgi:hypothetical protein